MKQLAIEQQNSGGGGIDPSELDVIKHEVLRDVTKHIKSSNSREQVLPDMRELKVQFDGQLRAHFDSVNEKVKGIELSVRDATKHKIKAFESIRAELRTQISSFEEEVAEVNDGVRQEIDQFIAAHGKPQARGSEGDSIKQSENLYKVEARVEEANQRVILFSIMLIKSS